MSRFGRGQCIWLNKTFKPRLADWMWPSLSPGENLAYCFTTSPVSSTTTNTEICLWWFSNIQVTMDVTIQYYSLVLNLGELSLSPQTHPNNIWSRTLYIFLGDFTDPIKAPPPICAPPFPLIKSPFFFLRLSCLLVKCSHTEAHCSKGPIHEAGRQWRGTQRAPHTVERAVSSALTHEGCVWAAPRHRGPADSDSDSSLLWTWPFTKPMRLPKQLATVNSNQIRKMGEWHKVWMVIYCCQLKTSKVILPCKMLAYNMKLKTQSSGSENETN